MELDFFSEITEMSENYQHSGPKQDSGENVAISSVPITKLKNKGTRRGTKTLNREAMLEKLGNAKTARKSLKVRKTECSSASNAETDTALHA